MFWEVKTQSAKICLNFNFQGWGGGGGGGEGGVLGNQNLKYQDLPKFQLGEGGVEGSQNLKCQDLSKFQFGGEGGDVLGGGGCSGKSKPKVPRSA